MTSRHLRVLEPVSIELNVCVNLCRLVHPTGALRGGEGRAARLSPRVHSQGPGRQASAQGERTANNSTTILPRQSTRSSAPSRFQYHGRLIGGLCLFVSQLGIHAIDVIETALAELKDSDRFVKLLELTLAVGNYMNGPLPACLFEKAFAPALQGASSPHAWEIRGCRGADFSWQPSQESSTKSSFRVRAAGGSFRGGAGGFSLSTLNKLSDVRSTSNKGATLLVCTNAICPSFCSGLSSRSSRRHFLLPSTPMPADSPTNPTALSMALSGLPCQACPGETPFGRAVRGRAPGT